MKGDHPATNNFVHYKVKVAAIQGIKVINQVNVAINLKRNLVQVVHVLIHQTNKNIKILAVDMIFIIMALNHCLITTLQVPATHFCNNG